jgi:aspartate/methionine/tyrosine aminotransferase
MQVAQRVQQLQPEGAYQVMARAQELEAAGHDIVHLEIGEPDFATDPRICTAGIEAITAGRTRYNPPSGIGPLRAAIAEDVSRRRGITVQPEQVVVGPGGKPALFFPTLALVEPGDEVIYPDPGFPTYRAMTEVAGGVPVPVPLVEENDFSFDLDAFDRLISDRTRLIVLNSPSNPTGGVMPQADLEHIAAAAQRHDCWVISDEIYARMAYDGIRVPSITTIDGMLERTILADGFSKTYAMTGWRLGYGIMPEPLAEKIHLMLVHSVGCTAHFTQFAGIEALTGPQDVVDMMVAEYQARRDALVAGLNAIPGVSCRTPQGAFYVFPNVRSFRRPAAELADLLLDEAGVALLPGTAFGQYGEGYLRLCYANSLENIQRAVARMGHALG